MLVPPPTFIESQSGTESFFDLATAGLAILPIVYCGWNRLTAIPLIVTLINATDGFTGWYIFTEPKRMSATGLFFFYLGCSYGEVYLLMYSYFILDRLLDDQGTKGVMRRTHFRIVFWILQGCHVCVRTSVLVSVMVSYEKGDYTVVLINDLVLAQFVLMASIECLTAYLLIRIFHNSRKMAVRFLGGRQVGLFKQMILSTEIRVASIATLGILRAILAIPKRTNRNANQVDLVAVIYLNAYPMVLVVDLLLTKAIKLEVDLQSRIERCRCLEQTHRIEMMPGTLAIPESHPIDKARTGSTDTSSH